MSRPLRDPSLGLACDETPLYMPKTMIVSQLLPCDTCKLHISAPIVGTKSITSRPGNDGLNVDESPLTELVFNNTKYNLYDTVIWKKGAHRDFKKKDTYDLEMNLYFRDVFNPLSLAAIAIPIIIDDSQANSYFTEMARQDVSIRTQSLEKLIGRGQVVMYKGMDLRNRNVDKPYAADQCHSATAFVLWFIIPPAYISQADAKKIRSIAQVSNRLPPKPSKDIPLQRLTSISAVIPRIFLKRDIETTVPNDTSKNGVYLTRALQCQRIDPRTDIKGDAVYLNGHGENTLEQEINTINEEAADSTKQIETNITPFGLKPKQVETYLATIIGIILGISCFAAVCYFLMNYVFKGYFFNLDKTMQTIIEKKQQECAIYSTPFILTGPAPPPKVEVPGLLESQNHLEHAEHVSATLSADITKKLLPTK